MPASSFVSAEAILLLPDMLQDGGAFSPCASQGILSSHHLLLGYLPSFSTGVVQLPQGSTLPTSQTSNTPVFVSIL